MRTTKNRSGGRQPLQKASTEELLRLRAQGLTNAQIAEKTGLSRIRIYQRIGPQKPREA